MDVCEDREGCRRFNAALRRAGELGRAGAHPCALTIAPPKRFRERLPARQLACRLRRGRNMSHKTVQFVIGWLLTDDDLRERFTERPRETLQKLCEQGYEL